MKKNIIIRNIINGGAFVTNRKWFKYHKHNNIGGAAVFYRSDTKDFKRLKPGDTFFFLVKNKSGRKGERDVLGCAIFEGYEVLGITNAWKKHMQALGFDLFQEFKDEMDLLNSQQSSDSKTDNIGCIVLSDFKVFTNPLKLSTLNIDFKDTTQQGMRLTSSQTNSILKNVSYVKATSIPITTIVTKTP